MNDPADERADDQSAPDVSRIDLPSPSIAPTALPSTMAHALAFTAVLVAGLCGGLVGWAVADLQCVGDCGTIATLGAVVGTIFAAGGVAIIAVLVLRAMSEWNAQAPLANGNGDMTSDARQLLSLAIEFADLAAERHRRRDFGSVDAKSSATDPVTQIDRDSEELITAAIQRHRPDDSIVGEEGVDVRGTSGVNWVIDPLDGTVNYVYGYPSHAVSIGVIAHGVTVAAVVHDSAMDIVYTAARGHGATRDGVPLRVTEVEEPAMTLLATGFGYDTEVRRRQGAVIGRVIPEVRDIRRSGSAAIDLCHVASGSVDAYYETGPNLWDVAAGMLIVEEAGGTARYDESTKRILAAGPAVYARLDELITGVERSTTSEFGQ